MVLGPYNPTASKTFAVMLGFCTSFVAAGSLFQGSLKHFVDNIVNIFDFALNHLFNDMVVSKDGVHERLLFTWGQYMAPHSVATIEFRSHNKSTK